MRTLLLSVSIAVNVALVGAATASPASIAVADIKKASALNAPFRHIAQQSQQRAVPGIRGYSSELSRQNCIRKVLDPNARRPGVYREVDVCRQKSPGVIR